MVYNTGSLKGLLLNKDKRKKKWKIGFGTWYGYYKYLIILFGLINASIIY